MKRLFPLKYYLLLISISLVLVVGGSIGWSSHITMKTILDSTTLSTSQSIRKELSAILQAESERAESIVSVLSHHPDLLHSTTQPRLAMLPVFTDILQKMPSFVTLYISDSDGHCLFVRKLVTESDHQRFLAPKESVYLLEEVGDGVGLHTLLDKDLTRLKSYVDAKTSQYDPRVRPWYKMAQASSEIIKTPVYDFFTTKEKGYTIAKRLQLKDEAGNQQTIILSADVRVGYLEEELEALKPTAKSRLSIVDDLGNLIAGSEIDKSRYLARLHNNVDIDESMANDSFYSVDEISTISGTPFYFVLDIPQSDIFKNSKQLYKSQLSMILIFLLLGIYVSLKFSERFSNEIKLLSQRVYNVKTFNFTKLIQQPSAIREIKRLSDDIDAVSDTVHAFKSLTYHITSAKTADKMVVSALQDILYFTKIPTAILFMQQDGRLTPFKGVARNKELAEEELQYLASTSDQLLSIEALNLNLAYSKNISSESNRFYELKKLGSEMFIVPLTDREGDNRGVLLFLSHDRFEQHKKKFITDLSPYLSLSLENKVHIDRQQGLFESFTRLIADAIDAKNPETAKHCIRVPELTKQLAHAVCNKSEGKFADFTLDDNEWEALHMAAWLHDCGKITTPEYILDKATKLETIHNRIHEIRMRFEILKLEKRLAYCKAMASHHELDDEALQSELRAIDEDFYFIARCNMGRPLSEADMERIDSIAEKTWTATLDDNIGLSRNELKRKPNKAQPLPRKEQLLSDKQEHIIMRHEPVSYPKELGIKLQAPTHLYNRGELTNIKIPKGTLTAEERFKINDHVIQSLQMLSALPLPKPLQQVPDWAASHHERMDGQGYPRNLSQEDMHPVARMIAIADVYEALTAYDRPYKTNKSHQEAINIMHGMAQQGHLDKDLFEIFVQDCQIPAC